MQVRPVARSLQDAEIGLMRLEVDRHERCRQAEVDRGMRGEEGAQPRHQPFGGEGRIDAEGEPRTGAGALQVQGGRVDPVEGLGYRPKQVGALLRRGHAMAAAGEQPAGEMGLEQRDLPADGARGDGEFLRSVTETAVPAGGFEGTQRVQRRQAMTHGAGFLQI